MRRAERFALIAGVDALRGIVAARFALAGRPAPPRPLSDRTLCPRSVSRSAERFARAQLARRSALFAPGASFARGFASRRMSEMFHVKHLFA